MKIVGVVIFIADKMSKSESVTEEIRDFILP